MPNSPRTWDFQEQLKKGRAGEELLLRHWPEPLRRHELLKGPDFVDASGRTIELKTDSYPMSKTENFFMERWSREGVLGGPWQALDKGATCLVYLFSADSTWFVFENLKKLVQRLNGLTASMYLHNIPNKGWTTQGYKVPREQLQGLWRMEVLPAKAKKGKA